MSTNPGTAVIYARGRCTPDEVVSVGETVLVGNRYGIDYGPATGRRWARCAVSIAAGRWAGMWILTSAKVRDTMNDSEETRVAQIRDLARQTVARDGGRIIVTTAELPDHHIKVPKRFQ